MKMKNNLLKYTCFGIIVISIVSNCQKIEKQADSEKNDQKPNIIIILADDLGYGDLECYGNEAINTPNLNKIASEGITFTDFHSNGAACSPTRAAFLTGRYQQRAGIQGVFLTWIESHKEMGLQPEEVTFADVLKQNGYKTATFGKWHLGVATQYNPVNHGFDIYKGILTGNVDYQNHRDTSGDEDWWNGIDKNDEIGYATDLVTEYGIDFIENNKDSSFCLYLAHAAPHFPYQGPDDPEFRVPDNTEQHHSPRTDRDVAYKEMIESLDQNIGLILETLEKNNLAEKTFVFFFSDNGPTGPGSTGMLNGKKGNLLEGGHRIPAIAYWPGKIPAGEVRNEIAMGMDLFPTILEIAGINNCNQTDIDGTSILPLMLLNTPLPERSIFWRTNKSKAVRKGPWKLLITISDNNEETFLFNLNDDIQERNNVSDKYPQIVLELKSELENWEEDVDNNGFPLQL